ncbi:DUF805 domain-containing protein [Sphingomonas sp.]|uniref:DUF805 domain-containing protein n=1 Tax=Sphingomonas sp. TaxID=28214 RepID=UPI001B084B0D|nr:DUF805 domain-containing protein [Sphingomonas sp.]MBO9712911.1 DUF805 domain-containing protein [Sphingomonas sp.]
MRKQDRINRQRYWTMLLAGTAALALASLLLREAPGVFWGGFGAVVILTVGPRLQDFGCSGRLAWLLAALLILDALTAPVSPWFDWFWGLIGIATFIVVGLVPSQPGANRYGDPPRRSARSRA